MKVYSVIIFTLLLLLSGCKNTSTGAKEYADNFMMVEEPTIENIDSTVIENLEVLGRVWGFVKYHHPVFTDYTYNIDRELFELLPKVTHATRSKRNKILVDWVDSFGKFKYSPEKYDSILAQSEHISTTDCAWINDTHMLGKRLSSKLQKLRYADRDTSIYVKQKEYLPTDIYSFINYNQYPYSEYLTADYKYRIVSLFSYWNIIEYFFPYRNLTDTDWNDILPKYIPQFLEADTLGYKFSMARLIAEINDSHGLNDVSFIFGDKQIPIEAAFIEDKLIVTDPQPSPSLEKSGFLPGDEIITIDGKTPDEIIALTKEYVACSNKASLLRNAAALALYSNNDTLRVTYSHNSAIKDVMMRSYTFNEISKLDRKPSKDNFRMINDSIGYLFPKEYNETFDLKALQNKINSTKALIIDHRCYPLLMPHLMHSIFSTSENEIAKLSCPRLELPGYFSYLPEKHEVPEVPNIYKGNIVVLVNSETQSWAEYATMMLQAYRNAVVIGSQTAGADGNVSRINLPGNIKTAFSNLGVFYPDGTPTQRIGVKIDHYVEPTIQGIKQGRDEVLEKALEVITAN